MTRPPLLVTPSTSMVYHVDAFGPDAHKHLAHHFETAPPAATQADAEQQVRDAVAAATQGWHLVRSAQHDTDVGWVFRRGEQWLVCTALMPVITSVLDTGRGRMPQTRAVNLLRQFNARRADRVEDAFFALASRSYSADAQTVARDLVAGVLAALPPAEAAGHRLLLALDGYGTGLTVLTDPPF